MQTVRLGRTGLDVTVAGLGCGGHSRLGMANGHDEAHASRIVDAAIGLGINFIDQGVALDRIESGIVEKLSRGKTFTFKRQISHVMNISVFLKIYVNFYKC